MVSFALAQTGAGKQGTTSSISRRWFLRLGFFLFAAGFRRSDGDQRRMGNRKSLPGNGRHERDRLSTKVKKRDSRIYRQNVALPALQCFVSENPSSKSSEYIHKRPNVSVPMSPSDLLSIMLIHQNDSPRSKLRSIYRFSAA